MLVARKMTDAEIATLVKNNGNGENHRKAIEAEYDTLLADYAVGEYVVIELGEGEVRATVRNRLNAAAERRGVLLHFIKTKGKGMRFKVEEKIGEVVEA